MILRPERDGQRLDVYLAETVEGLSRSAAQKLIADGALTLDGQSVRKMDKTIAGREYALEIPTEKVGTFDTELVEEFWQGFVRKAQCNLHIRQLAGTNSHHIIEGAFKSAARSMRTAVSIDPAFAGEIPSTKGML